ncbi:MAG: hypothetical protein M0026_17395 [Nocardiopsaceae bacterium]|nr:hypothetical protein [Nocardiopsaceae bacterium]
MQTKYIVAGWVAAAAVAVTASVAAVGVAQGGLLSHPAQPMSEEDVSKELAKAPAASGESAAPSAGVEGSTEPSAEPSAPAEQPTGHLDAVPEDADAGGKADSSGESETVFPSDGGTVLARCADGLVELVWWAPEQGYQTGDVAQGPAEYAEVEFEGGEQEYEYSLTCADGQPQASIEADG